MADGVTAHRRLDPILRSSRTHTSVGGAGVTEGHSAVPVNGVQGLHSLQATTDADVDVVVKPRPVSSLHSAVLTPIQASRGGSVRDSAGAMDQEPGSLAVEAMSEEDHARSLQAAFASSPIRRMQPHSVHSPATPTTVEVLIHADRRVTPGSPIHTNTQHDPFTRTRPSSIRRPAVDGLGTAESVDHGSTPTRATEQDSVYNGDTMGHITIFIGTWNMNNLTTVHAAFTPFLRPTGGAAAAAVAGSGAPTEGEGSSTRPPLVARADATTTVTTPNGTATLATAPAAATETPPSPSPPNAARPAPVLPLAPSPVTADMYVLGTQECSLDRRAWQAKIVETLGAEYELLDLQELQPIKMCIFVRSSIRRHIDNIETAAIPTKLGGALMTKGAVGMSMKIAGAPFLFINSHLPAHQGGVADRNLAYRTICQGLPLPHKDHLEQAFQLISTPSRRARKVSVVDRFPYVFWMGDLNYRIDADRASIDSCLASGDYPALWAADQLKNEMAQGSDGVFHGFQEGELAFKPTYKFDRGTNTYDTSEKRRLPAWTDRVLYREREPNTIECLEYTSCPELLESDHKPVRALFAVDIPQSAWCPRDIDDEAAATIRDMLKTARLSRLPASVQVSTPPRFSRPHVNLKRQGTTPRSKREPKKPKSAVCVIV
eukprot:m.358517 g.358517  ORF g.358517 m.358517 type:complete len:659 (-) comp28031_c0_seq2:263-2239(-)